MAEDAGCVSQEAENAAAQQMYSAMAERMQSDGLNVTAGDVENLFNKIENQTPEAPADITETDEQILEQMAEYQREYEMQNPAYVVRGALAKCEFGSHCRRLNLPLCHGVYAMKRPVMFRADNVGGAEGDDINIPSFGICSSPDNPSGETVCLEKEAPRNDDGSFTGAAAGGVIRGKPCVPKIVELWDEVHEDTLVGEEREPALLTRSYIVCQYKGLIQIIRSGQEDD